MFHCDYLGFKTMSQRPQMQKTPISILKMSVQNNKRAEWMVSGRFKMFIRFHIL